MSRGTVKNYNYYKFHTIEWIKSIIYALMLQTIIAYLFYQSLFAIFILFPVGIYSIYLENINLKKRQKDRLLIEFKETILSISSSLHAGFSVENACVEAIGDLLLLYGKDSLMVQELKRMQYAMSNNIGIELLFLDLAKRSGLEEIDEFSKILQVAKLRGGNLTEIIQNSVNHITEKLEVKTDIETIISAKKMEQKVMSTVPFFIILYLQTSSPGFFQPLYHNILGNIIMTVCLLGYFFSITLARKIVNIEV